ncbi:hypothetical protein KAR91_53670, partial [Candidatus Pacearchaeota archaeon]|nr:hypothetical protein [Candidatus Pacearchaeota archaeon]
MAEGMQKTAGIPPEMMESLGLYKEGVKEARKDIKELEKEAKRIQKKGGLIPDELKERLGVKRKEVERLEDRIDRQKQEKRRTKDFQRRFGDVERMAKDPLGTAKRLLMQKAATSKLGMSVKNSLIKRFGVSSLSGAAGKAASALAAPLAIGAAGILVARQIWDIQTEGARLDNLRAQGEAQTQEVLLGMIQQSAGGGIAASSFENIEKRSRQEANRARRVLTDRGLTTKMKSWWYGNTEKGQTLEDKLIKNEVRREINRIKFGAGYGEAIDAYKNKQFDTMTRRNLYEQKATWINHSGNMIAEILSGTRNADYVDFSYAFSPFQWAGITSTSKEQIEEEINEELKKKHEEAWVKKRRVA